MKLGTQLKMAALAAGIGLSGVASATTFYFGDVTSTPAFFASGFVDHSAGAFTDYDFFSVSLPSYGGLTLADNPITSFLGTIIRNIDGLSASLYIDKGVIGVKDGADVLYAPPTPPSDYISVSTPFTPGNYYIQVTGAATGVGQSPSTVAGTYAYSGFISSVPEPETYALMAAGILMMGVIARRRSTKI